MSNRAAARPARRRAHPAVRVGGGALLDAEQRLAHLHGHRAGLRVGDRNDPCSVLHLTDRRHDGGGTAGEHLADRAVGAALLPLLGADPALDSPARCRAPRVRIESRVTPGSSVPVSAG